MPINRSSRRLTNRTDQTDRQGCMLISAIRGNPRCLLPFAANGRCCQVGEMPRCLLFSAKAILLLSLRIEVRVPTNRSSRRLTIRTDQTDRQGFQLFQARLRALGSLQMVAALATLSGIRQNAKAPRIFPRSCCSNYINRSIGQSVNRSMGDGPWRVFVN